MIRIGHGYDIHCFEEISTKSYLTLGGVSIPYERGIVAHSDGDVVIHAICDAMLGALALGDIGMHFPDTSLQYKNCDSRWFLRQVWEKISALGFAVGNIDVSVIAQKPKLAPHILAMKENISQDLKISISDISVKARTNEGLDSLGQQKGIAAHAVALLFEGRRT